MKSSYPDEFCRIPRQSDFHIFRGNGCRVTLKDEIVYENLESREMTWVKFMGYNLNLNRDKINGFGPELDSNEGGHVARRGPHIQLKLSWDKRGIRAKRAHFSYWFTREREREREREESQASFQDLWSSVGRFSSGQEQKFIASTRGTCRYLKRGISPKIQEGRFREIEVVGFRRLRTHVSRA